MADKKSGLTLMLTKYDMDYYESAYKTYNDNKGKKGKKKISEIKIPTKPFIKDFMCMHRIKELSLMDVNVYNIIHNKCKLEKLRQYNIEKIKFENGFVKEHGWLNKKDKEYVKGIKELQDKFSEMSLSNFNAGIGNEEILDYINKQDRKTVKNCLDKLSRYGFIEVSYTQGSGNGKVRTVKILKDAERLMEEEIEEFLRVKGLIAKVGEVEVEEDGEVGEEEMEEEIDEVEEMDDEDDEFDF